jgi:hypothetical protein
MKDFYRVSYLGAAGGAVAELIKQFGPTEIVESFQPGENNDVFIVDCKHVGHHLTPEQIQSALNSDQTLGILNMNERNRSALSAVTGRNFGDDIQHIFVRHRTDDPSQFTYTVVPTRDFLVSWPPAEAAAYLRRRVFAVLSGGGSYAYPDVEENYLWPYPPNPKSSPTKLLSICGSVIDLVDNQNCQNSYRSPLGEETQTAVFSSKGYFFSGGDGSPYHVIILTHVMGASPVEHDNEHSYVIDAGYAVRVTPMQNGQGGCGVSIEQPSPQPGSTGNDNHLGNYITIDFQHSFDVNGRDSSGNSGPFPISPYYSETIGQRTFPTVGDFVISNDTSNEQVRFATDDGMWSHQNDLVKSTTVRPIELDTPPMTPLQMRQFTTVHYMIFQPPLAGTKSLPVSFEIEVTLGAEVWMLVAESTNLSGLPSGDTTYYFMPTRVSREVDLIAATQEHPTESH